MGCERTITLAGWGRAPRCWEGSEGGFEQSGREGSDGGIQEKCVCEGGVCVKSRDPVMEAVRALDALRDVVSGPVK